jgi:hypothetical protein
MVSKEKATMAFERKKGRSQRPVGAWRSTTMMRSPTTAGAADHGAGGGAVW